MPYPISNKSAKTSGQSDAKSPSGESSWLKGLVTLIVILVIIGGGIYLVSSYTGLGVSLPSGITGKSISFDSNWQAVFLSNGQVYFGQVMEVDNSFIYLSDIYYLQVVTLQDTISQPSDVQTQPEQRLTLIKLGNELHGPTDEMMINRDHIIIIENLQDDSRVVQAIDDYLSGAEPEIQ